MLRLTESVDGRLAREHKRSGSAFWQYYRNEEGSLILFGLFLFVVMLAIAGIGVDYMRYEAQRVRLQATLDRAVLAASSLSQPLDPQSVVLDYFDKAGLAAYISADDIHVSETAISRHVDASASMDMGTTLLRFSDITTLNTPAASAAEESISNTEISLILDVSGSMTERSSAGGSKIDLLKDAAKKFVNIVMCDPTNPTATTGCVVPAGLVSMNIVPYSEQVVVGEDLLRRFNVTMEHTASSCVTFDEADFSTTAITPGQRIKRTGQIDEWNSGSVPAGSWGGWTCKPEAWREITAMEGDAAKLRKAIGLLDADGSTSIELGMKWGSALLDPAFAPIASDMANEGKVDSTFAGRPATGLSQKVIVLMTDGINTRQAYLYDNFRDGPAPVWRTKELTESYWWGEDFSYSIYDASKDLYWWETQEEWQDHPYGSRASYEKTTCTGGYYTRTWWGGKVWVPETCTTETVMESGNGAVQMSFPELWSQKNWNWWKRFTWLPSPGTDVVNTWYNPQKDQRLDAICTAAKDAGYIVFAVGFEVSSASDVVMSKCATDSSHYFSADGSNIAAAFASIALSINKLRLVN